MLLPGGVSVTVLAATPAFFLLAASAGSCSCVSALPPATAVVLAAAPPTLAPFPLLPLALSPFLAAAEDAEAAAAVVLVASAVPFIATAVPLTASAVPLMATGAQLPSPALASFAFATAVALQAAPPFLPPFPFLAPPPFPPFFAATDEVVVATVTCVAVAKLALVIMILWH